MATLLIERRADPTVHSDLGTAADVAKINKHLEIYNLLKHLASLESAPPEEPLVSEELSAKQNSTPPSLVSILLQHIE
jgi:hypothetical protein